MSTSVAERLRYLNTHDLFALQAAAISATGESPAPLLAGGREKLESAAMRPRMAAHYDGADLFDRAALLAGGTAVVHALVDNNKRLAYVAILVFLRINGHPVRETALFALAQRIEGLLTGTESEAALGAWLREAATET